MIKQGHLYKIQGRKCIAMQSGVLCKFWQINDNPKISDLPEVIYSHMNDAKPLGMKYHGGEVPA